MRSFLMEKDDEIEDEDEEQVLGLHDEVQNND